MTKLTFLISKPPYDKNNAFTGARIAVASKMDDHEVNVVLIEDGIYCGVKGQETGDETSAVELLEHLVELGNEIQVCGMCAKRRGIKEDGMIDGCKWITLHELVRTMAESDQTIFF